jgi:hypothetical protein
LIHFSHFSHPEYELVSTTADNFIVFVMRSLVLPFP